MAQYIDEPWNSFSTTLDVGDTGNCWCLQITISCVILFICTFFYWPNKRKKIKSHLCVPRPLSSEYDAGTSHTSRFDLSHVCAYIGCVVMITRRHIKCGFCAKSIYLQTLSNDTWFLSPFRSHRSRNVWVSKDLLWRHERNLAKGLGFIHRKQYKIIITHVRSRHVLNANPSALCAHNCIFYVWYRRVQINDRLVYLPSKSNFYCQITQQTTLWKRFIIYTHSHHRPKNVVKILSEKKQHREVYIMF